MYTQGLYIIITTRAPYKHKSKTYRFMAENDLDKHFTKRCETNGSNIRNIKKTYENDTRLTTVIKYYIIIIIITTGRR